MIGIDIDATAVDTASKHSADVALTSNLPDLEPQVLRLTSGLGADAVADIAMR